MEGGEGRGHTVAAARLQLVSSGNCGYFSLLTYETDALRFKSINQSIILFQVKTHKTNLVICFSLVVRLQY